ncbi:hypothetical protein A500_00965 [Clostridium sartagoforme AAU1]|uniref:Prepilin-type N-terminal cleavage/methylation domain-containing protein n=1 Tax=Clostridium sartagoforme AAU1 TaxID=1202534 RepID=R9CFP1_9CLOT|nr:type II secretion system protein [Clostridium sartagoforme]EOR28103.1 hypothetical protein A500_00965 [Clostridium sartagoforme AAU1]
MTKYSNKKKKKYKKYNFTIIEMITLIVLIIALMAILIPNFKKYSVDTKKAEVKSIIQDFIMAVEIAKVKDNIEVLDSDSIKSMEDNSDKNLSVIKNYIDDSKKIEKIKYLKIEEAKQIITDSADFEIDKEGNFLRIINEKE